MSVRSVKPKGQHKSTETLRTVAMNYLAVLLRLLSKQRRWGDGVVLCRVDPALYVDLKFKAGILVSSSIQY